MGSLLFLIAFWLLFLLAITVFAYRAYQLFRWVKIGRYENRFDHLGKRLMIVIGRVFLQVCSLRSVTRKDLAGIGHAVMFWGFIAFLFNYVTFIFIGDGLGLSETIGQATFSQYLSLVVDIAGVLVALAIIWAAIRRYILRPERLEPTSEAAIILVLILFLILTHFFVEGFRINIGEDRLAAWTPVGSALANFFGQIRMGKDLQTILYGVTQWTHYATLLGFLVFLLYSKHLHIVVSPLNIFFSSLRPKGALVPIDVEKAETCGVNRINQFTWKQLLDLYACTQCGRCQTSCPAYLTGKPLNPKQVVLSLKEYLFQEAPSLVKTAALSGSQAKPLIGDVLTEDILWSCTTCQACEEQCPALIEHIGRIVDMRRSLVERGLVPGGVARCLESMLLVSNPWGYPQGERADWSTGLRVKLSKEDTAIDLLYWVGCSACYDPKGQEIARAMVNILNAADVNYAILGVGEKCCGEPARRLGEEGLFQELAAENISTLKRHKIAKIITSCPHCYNTLKNEYPQLGGYFEVIHHTMFLAGLLKDGIMRMKDFPQRVTYHDPCYLGRLNNIYAPPRQILRAIPKLSLVEMHRNQSRALCCGGGGGHMWLEMALGKRINNLRFEDVQATQAQMVITACPFCKIMLDDASSVSGQRIKVSDIAELVYSCNT